MLMSLGGPGWLNVITGWNSLCVCMCMRENGFVSVCACVCLFLSWLSSSFKQSVSTAVNCQCTFIVNHISIYKHLITVFLV